jgi:hypothetical protein
MAFIGTPLDTRNTFQSLVGKRFSGDGSTTAFTLDVAPSSTLDIEVFVGNVRQDPNSAYTLSGTTLTFTGAPPSGTNNIYVVHQARSVGTIGIPDDTISARTLVTLDNSADHVLIEDATDGELKKALIPAASFAGIDDQTSSNDDQLTITDTAVVINEDSDDVDFRVEGNGEANLLYVDAGEDKIYSGISSKSVHAAGFEPHIQIEGTGDNKNSVSLTQNSNNNGAPTIIMCKTRGTSVGATTIVQDNDYLGNIYFSGADGNDRQTYGAHIIARVDGTPGENDMPTELKFGTTSDGASTSSDRLAIKANGKVVIAAENMANDVAAGNAGISLFNTNSGSLFFGFGTGTETQMNFGNDNGVVGSIQTSGSGTSFNTSSDYRLKENVDYTWDATTRLKQLKPARFNFIADDTNTLLDGFLAHEVLSIVPEAVSGEKDATEIKTKVVVSSKGGILAEGIEQSDWTQGKESGKYPSDSTWEASKTSIIAQGIDQAKLVPLLVKTVQELEARIKTLEEA